MRSEYGCRCVVKFIREEVEPENEYLKESKRRLTLRKPEYKDRYYNVNNGVMRA